MAVLSGQSVVAGVALPNSANATGAGTVANSFGNLAQGLLRAIAVSSIGFSSSSQVTLIANYSTFTSQGNFQNYLSSFARFFGVNARQDISKIYINKNDFSTLTAKSNNTAESLLVALLLRINEHESNSLISQVVVEIWKQQFLQGLKLSTILIHIYPLFQGSLTEEEFKSLSPNDMEVF